MGRLSLNPESFPQIYNFFFLKKGHYETTGEGEHCGRVILMNDRNFVVFFKSPNLSVLKCLWIKYNICNLFFKTPWQRRIRITELVIIEYE